MATLRFFGGLLLVLAMCALAFAAIFAFGWVVVHLVGPALLRIFPAPVAVLVIAGFTGLAVYGAVMGLPALLRRRRAPRETSPV